MAAPFNPSFIVPVGIGALILWRTYARIRRMVGRQHLSNVRPWITVFVFLLLILLLAGVSIARPESLAMLFYTPSAHVGIAVSLLFVGRLLYRMIQIYGYGIPGAGAAPTPGKDPNLQYASSPLTLLTFGVLAGYYVTYAIGLLRWKSLIKNEPPTADSVTPGS